jgi:hypothetical protein
VLKVECFARSVIEHVVVGHGFIPRVALDRKFEVGIPDLRRDAFLDEVGWHMIVKSPSE